MPYTPNTIALYRVISVLDSGLQVQKLQAEVFCSLGDEKARTNALLNHALAQLFNTQLKYNPSSINTTPFDRERIGQVIADGIESQVEFNDVESQLNVIEARLFLQILTSQK
jgi:hypothetical protein